MYLLFDKSKSLDTVYIILLKISVCFTAIISYLNDKEKMLAISNKGLLFEDIDSKNPASKFSFLFIIILIVYNPIIPHFTSIIFWAICDAFTVVFFWLQTDNAKKEK